MGGQTAPMRFWHRPLHAMTDAFTAAGFRIAVISEPAPARAARERYPDDIAAKPRFLCSCSSSCRPTSCRASSARGSYVTGTPPWPAQVKALAAGQLR